VKIGRQVFGKAVEWGYTKVNPFTAVQIFEEDPTEDNEKIHILSADQTSAVACCGQIGDPLSSLLVFLWNPAGKPGKAQWSDVNFAEKRVIVPGFAGKLKKRYPVTLSENLLEWLQPYMTEKGSILALDRNGKPNTVTSRKLVP
jgi:hypothetical protein